MTGNSESTLMESTLPFICSPPLSLIPSHPLSSPLIPAHPLSMIEGIVVRRMDGNVQVFSEGREYTVTPKKLSFAGAVSRLLTSFFSLNSLVLSPSIHSFLFLHPTPPPLPHHQTESKGSLLSPMPGEVVKVNVKVGDVVEAGQVLLVLEAMKMLVPILHFFRFLSFLSFTHLHFVRSFLLSSSVSAFLESSRLLCLSFFSFPSFSSRTKSKLPLPVSCRPFITI